MSTRPTPEEIIADFLPAGTFPSLVLDALAAHGYRIVHPDDVPEKSEEWRGIHVDPTCAEPMQARGWNDCRRQIFGEGA